MLLQALDLLDRGLVECYVISDEGTRGAVVPGGSEVGQRKKDEDEKEKQKENWKGKETNPERRAEGGESNLPSTLPQTTNTVQKTFSSSSTQHHNYQVRSSQSFQSHFTNSTSTKNTGRFPSHAHQASVYTVHLEAWNCSCAAFAFSAFPYVSSNPSSAKPWGYEALFNEGEEVDMRTEEVEMGEEEERSWEFGGLSLHDQREGEEDKVPMCKHLLACLLAEKWDALKGWVESRSVGMDEGAGLAVGG